ncbi:MAG TPA: hypothetical protein VN759_06670 [Pseudolysinimonas sp.]|nr:hypothetical protein [Pseudolysinimonas sp.]
MADLFIDIDGVFALTKALDGDVRTVESGGSILSDGMDATVEAGGGGDLGAALAVFVDDRRMSAPRIASHIATLRQVVGQAATGFVAVDARMGGSPGGTEGA